MEPNAGTPSWSQRIGDLGSEKGPLGELLLNEQSVIASVREAPNPVSHARRFTFTRPTTALGRSCEQLSRFNKKAFSSDCTLCTGASDKATLLISAESLLCATQ